MDSVSVQIEYVCELIHRGTSYCDVFRCLDLLLGPSFASRVYNVDATNMRKLCGSLQHFRHTMAKESDWNKWRACVARVWLSNLSEITRACAEWQQKHAGDTVIWTLVDTINPEANPTRATRVKRVAFLTTFVDYEESIEWIASLAQKPESVWHTGDRLSAGNMTKHVLEESSRYSDTFVLLVLKYVHGLYPQSVHIPKNVLECWNLIHPSLRTDILRVHGDQPDSDGATCLDWCIRQCNHARAIYMARIGVCLRLCATRLGAYNYCADNVVECIELLDKVNEEMQAQRRDLNAKLREKETARLMPAVLLDVVSSYT